MQQVEKREPVGAAYTCYHELLDLGTYRMIFFSCSSVSSDIQAIALFGRKVSVSNSPTKAGAVYDSDSPGWQTGKTRVIPNQMGANAALASPSGGQT